MRFKTVMKLLTSGQVSLITHFMKTTNEFYRAGFVAAAASNGVYDKFVDGKADFESLCDAPDITFNREGFRAWLELGVSLGELKRVASGYQIKGRLSRALLKKENDPYNALLEEIVKNHYDYVLHTPRMLQEAKRFPFSEAPGELIARSSRISEPFIFEAVDAAVPRKGAFRLLEVGCGSGVYIRRACRRNPKLEAVGLELQEKVAQFARQQMAVWGLEERVRIEHCDVRTFSTEQVFDLVTLHQNIYYFAIEDRVALARHLIQYLRSGGQLLITTIGPGGGPAAQTLNVWTCTTEGYGPLPEREQLCNQLREAGFKDVEAKRLMPFESFWAYVARKP